MDENAVEVLRAKNWAVLKADYIQTSAEHRCIRKILYPVKKSEKRIRI